MSYIQWLRGKRPFFDKIMDANEYWKWLDTIGKSTLIVMIS